VNLEFRNPGNIRAEGGGGHVPVSDYAAKVFCFLLFFGGGSGGWPGFQVLICQQNKGAEWLWRENA